MTVIVPSWQTRELLLRCLAGLEACTGRFVVVDNASTDGSADAVRERFPHVTVLQNARNIGFSGAVNRGLEHALTHDPDGPAVLLNADTLCPPDALHTLSAYLAAHHEIGLVGPHLLLPDGTPQPYAFGNDPSLGYLLRRGWNRRVHGRALHDWSDTRDQRVDWVTFACVAASLDMVRQVGLLDERFFMYFEDNDWCLRARRAGWGVARVGQARVTHIGGASLRQNPAAKRAYTDSLRRFHAKHYGALSAFALRLLLPLYGMR